MQVLVRKASLGWTLTIEGSEYIVTTATAASGVGALLAAFGCQWDDLSFESAQYRREFTQLFAF
jgi:hypothetical protein